MIDKKKINVITQRAEAALNVRPGIEVNDSWSNRAAVAEDVLYLIQCIELQAAQIEVLVAPEAMIAFMRRFHSLPQPKKRLVVELINEFTPEESSAT